jgi:hypothetical protein
MLIDRIKFKPLWQSPDDPPAALPIVETVEAQVTTGDPPAPEPISEPKEPEPKPNDKPALAPKSDPNAWKERKLQERIDKLTAQKSELERKVASSSANPNDEAALAARIEELANVRAEAKANEIANAREFQSNVKAMVDLGETEYGKEKFGESVKSLAQLYDKSDSVASQRYFDMLQAMVDTGEGHRLVAELATDLNEASRIMNLSPVKMGIALAKLAATKPDPISGAPKPITPLASKGASHDRIEASDRDRADRLSIDAWMERRNAEVGEVNKRAGRRVL